MEPWSWYNRAFFPISYRHFAAELASALPNTRLVRLDPGASVRLSDHRVLPGPELPWIERTTEEEVDYVADLVVSKVNKLRELSPLYEMALEGIDLKSIEWAAH